MVQCGCYGGEPAGHAHSGGGRKTRVGLSIGLADRSNGHPESRSGSLEWTALVVAVAVVTARWRQRAAVSEAESSFVYERD